MLADILGTNCDQYLSMVQYCFTSTETVRLIRTESPGRSPQLSHSSWTLNLKHQVGWLSVSFISDSWLVLSLIFFVCAFLGVGAGGPPIKIQNDLHKTTESRLQQELDFGLGIDTDLNSSIKGLHGFSTYFLMWPSDVEIVICRGKSRSGKCNPNMHKWRLCEKYTTKHYLFSYEDFIVETDTVNLC